MPRSASSFSMPGWASWLLAPPQMIRAFSSPRRVVVDRAAERARRVDVDGGGEQALAAVRRLDRGVLGPDPLHRARVHVAHDDLGAVVDQVPDQVAADLADAFDADRAAREAARAPDVLGRGAHALEDAERGEHRGVAGAAVAHRPAGHVLALAGHDVHVLAVGADVAGGDVAAVQRLHEPAVGAQQRLGLEPRRVADDDRLAAAVVEAGQGVLVGHRAGQVQHVGRGPRPRPDTGRSGSRRAPGRARSSRWR